MYIIDDLILMSFFMGNKKFVICASVVLAVLLGVSLFVVNGDQELRGQLRGKARGGVKITSTVPSATVTPPSSGFQGGMGGVSSNAGQGAPQLSFERYTQYYQDNFPNGSQNPVNLYRLTETIGANCPTTEVAHLGMWKMRSTQPAQLTGLPVAFGFSGPYPNNNLHDVRVSIGTSPGGTQLINNAMAIRSGNALYDGWGTATLQPNVDYYVMFTGLFTENPENHSTTMPNSPQIRESGSNLPDIASSYANNVYGSFLTNGVPYKNIDKTTLVQPSSYLDVRYSIGYNWTTNASCS